MRVLLILGLVLSAYAVLLGKNVAPAAHATHTYRVGKAPKAEFKVAGKSYKLDPEAKSAKQIRALPAEHFDPVSRPHRVESFYRETLKDRFEECRREARWHCGPFRPEFIYWVQHHWRAEWRARWAWHHRQYIDELLWAEWMRDKLFAAEIAALQRANTPVEPGYLPPEYASISPVVVYNDEYMNAVYNPVPFLAVLSLKSIKADKENNWIATAAADTLLSKLSSVPGMFVADQAQVASASRQPGSGILDVADPASAARVGKAIDVERVVTGSYVADGDKVLFNLRIVDVQTGAVENGISKTVARDHLLDEMPGLATSLAEAMGYSTAPETETAAVTVLPKSASADHALSGAVTVGAAPDSATMHPSQPAALVPPGRSIFQESGPNSGGPAATVAGAAPARKTITATDKLTGDTTFTAEDGPYEIQDKLSVAEGVKKCTLHIGPGAELHGGWVDGSKSLHIDIEGTPEKPAIIRHVNFWQNLGSSFKAKYAIFDDCRFRKGGSYYSTSGFSSKWEFDKCIVRGNAAFPRITHVDYGIKFTDCTFSGVKFEEIAMSAPKEGVLDHMKSLRTGWRTIDRCHFDACTVPQTFFWCATSSNYTRCHFAPGPAFESDTPTDVNAYVAETDGDSPDRVAQNSPPKRAALRIVYVPKPFDVFAFPGR